MRTLLKKSSKQKTLFRSYYCLVCKQKKPCQLLTSWDSYWRSYCCSCYYQNKQEKAKEYPSYQQVYQQKVKESKERFQQLQLLKSYLGCKKCGSKEVDAYNLYENSRLVCQPCLIAKESGASSPISFSGQSKWYQRYWGINLGEMLENFAWLPINKKCANKWKENNQHLVNCACLEQEAQESFELFSNSLKEKREQLKECQCETSSKIRVSSDYYVWCENCGESIPAASKKRVIKNRNDPKFWGLKVKQKVLCGNCLASLVDKMTTNKQYTFNKYQKRGYWTN